MRRMSVLLMFLAVVLGLALNSVALAGAQASPTLSGITVVGRGVATAPADSATLQLVIGEPSYGPPVVPQPGEVPGERERAAMEPIVTTLVKAGVPQDQIDVIVGPAIAEYGTYIGPAMAVLRFTVDDPDLEQLNEMVTAATVAATDERLFVGRITAIYTVDDCGTLEQEARAAAVDEARRQADAMAELLDLELGDITASRDVAQETLAASGPYGPIVPVNTCGAPDPATLGYSAFSLPPFDPTAEPEVRATVRLEVTWDTFPPLGATPAA